MPTLTRFGFMFALAGGLLAMAPPLAEPYVAVKWVSIAAGGALAWLGLSRSRPRRTTLDLPLAVLWLALLVSAARSTDSAASVFGMYPQAFYGLIPLFLCTGFFYAAAQLSQGAGAEDVLGWILTISIPLTAYGIIQRAAGDPLTSFPLPNGRITSTIGAPVMLGACLVLLTPIAIHRALDRKSRFAWMCLALIVAALVMTWARGAWLSAGASAVFYLWATGRVRRPSRLSLLAAAVLAPLLLFALQKGLKKQDSDSIRVESLKSAAAAFAARPLLGWGPDTFQLAFRRYKTDKMVKLTHETIQIQTSAHDDLVQVAVTLGLLGLMSYAWLLWALGSALRRSAGRPDGRARAAAIAAALIGLFLQAKVNPIPPSALLLAAVLAGLACGEDRPLPRLAAPLMAALFAACAVLYGRFCAADYQFRLGREIVGTRTLRDPSYMTGVNALRRATELDPWVIDYLSQRCDVMFRVAPQAPPEQGRQLLEKALALTDEGVRRHPGNPTAHELRATALALVSRFGPNRLPEALLEIKKAGELDPTFSFTLRRRMDLDRAAGDRVDFERAKADYLRVVALTGESPDWTPLL